MAGSKQTIGDISGARNLRVQQIDERGSEQAVGSVSHVTNTDIQQLSFADHTVAIREIVAMLDRLTDSERADAASQLQQLLLGEVPDAGVTGSQLQASAELAVEALPAEAPGRSLLNDASAAVGLISGSVAIATLADPYLLAVAVPASLAATGFLQKDKLSKLYGKIRQLLSRSKEESPDR